MDETNRVRDRLIDILSGSMHARRRYSRGEEREETVSECVREE